MHQPAEYVEIVLEVVETSLARPVRNVSADHGNRSSWPSKYRPCPLLKDAADHLGRKSGRGSYRQTEWAQTTPISYVKSERSLAGTIEAIRLSILGKMKATSLVRGGDLYASPLFRSRWKVRKKSAKAEATI